MPQIPIRYAEKQMRRVLYILVLMVMVLSGCTDDKRVVGLLERAEAYLPTQADSAEVCLDSIPHSKSLSGPVGAWYGLLRTIVDNHLKDGVKSDSLIRDSYEYYREASHVGQTSNQELLRHYAQSCYYMALYYSSCDSTKECEDLLHQAIKGSEKCEDWHTCYLAYTKLGNVTDWSNPDYAIQQTKRALDIYHKINDNVNNEVLILGHIAGCFLTSTEPDSALAYYMKGLELAQKNHLVKSENAMYMGIAGTYLYYEEYEKALNYARMGITTAEGKILVPSQLTLAQCYYTCDSLDKAKEVLNSIPCDEGDYLDKYLILRNMTEIVIQKGEFDSLYTFVDSAYECLENRFFHLQQEKFGYYQSCLTKELEKEQISHKAEMHRWIWGTITLFLLLIASFIIYNVIRHKKRMAVEHQKEIRHQQEIIHQKSLMLSVLQKHLLEKLEHARQLLSDDNAKQMTDEAWKEIEQLINATDNDFVQRLRHQHPDFKETDLQLCMLVRLKVTNAIIAQIYHVGESAIKKRKSTLKKTGFQIDDPNITIEQIIENL